MLQTIVKQPAEQLRHQLPFATSAAIGAAGAVSVAPRGLVPGAAALVASAAVMAGAFILQIAGGGDGERYLVTARATDTSGELLESELDVAVVEATWALPDGGAPYLSIGDFVERFGFDEVVAMTDATGAGRIDRPLLTRALADAQAIAEGYLAGRYALPLASVPPLVALAIADIARARLYPRGAPEGVAGNAAASTKLLQSIQAGTMPLAITGASAPEAPSDAPVVSIPGRRAYPDGLAGY